MAMLDMENNSNLVTLILDPVEALGILDLRLLGYYKKTARGDSTEVKQIL